MQWSRDALDEVEMLASQLASQFKQEVIDKVNKKYKSHLFRSVNRDDVQQAAQELAKELDGKS
jgi:hypothetical protein